MGPECVEFLKRVTFSGDEETDRVAREFITAWFEPSDFIVAHTSGSTGTPKEIRLPKSDMKISAQRTNTFYGIGADNTLLCPLSLNYIAGKMMAVRAIISGAALIIERPSNTPLERDYGKIRLMSVVPSQLQSLLQNPRLNAIENLLVGGAPVDAEMETGLSQIDIDVWMSYGMTETCSHVALRRAGDALYQALPGVEFGYAPDNSNRLVVDCRGMSAGRLLTNDVVELIEGHRFRWVGRYDSAINSGGVKVFPEEIERSIRSVIPQEVEYMIARTKDEKWGETPALVVVKSRVAPEKLLAKARMVLTGAQRPSRVIEVDCLPKARNGKLDRSAEF